MPVPALPIMAEWKNGIDLSQPAAIERRIYSSNEPAVLNHS
jgi:hypothetical protein